MLKGFKPEDWKDLQEYVSLEEVTRYDHEYPSSDIDCKGIVEFFSRSEGFWTVHLKDTGKMIGHIVCTQKEPKEFLTWELGFVFNPSFYGKGYASESCQCIMKYVFEELKAHRIESHCHPDNTPAWRLLERLSMRREAHHRKNGFLRRSGEGEPIWWDSFAYAILEEDWRIGIS